jgi:hypothetical protein
MSVNAHATYKVELWGKCKHFVRSEDGKPAAPHNHVMCVCPSCAKVKRKIYRCVMTEAWVFKDEVHQTQEQGG